MKLDTASLENRVLEEGQSAELAACFQVIGEATVDDGEKFSEKTCRDLARTIVCRTYASAVHELCHLVVAAAAVDRMGGRYENLFWDTGSARARNFHTWFDANAALAPAEIEIGRQHITINYADKPFAVTYGRMPFLAALMEFLMTTLGYGELDDALTPLTTELPRAAGVSEAANALSRQVYSYLADHLPPVQDQRKHHSFLGFIAERADGEPAAQAITDDTVLDYWIDNATGEGDEAATDARTYRGVFKTAVRLLGILRLAADKHGMAVALPIGADREAGEVDPNELEIAIAEIDETCEPLAALEATATAGVKLLNKRELETLRQALHGVDAGRTLPRSILRNAVFGDAQARLIQALRKGLDAEQLSQRIEAEPEGHYDDRIAAFAEIAAHTERMLLICFDVLFAARHRDAVVAALALRPDIDLSDLGTFDTANEAAANDDNVVSFQAEQAMRNFFDAAKNAGPLAVLAEQAAKAAKGIARQGFSDAERQNPATIEAFAASVPELAQVQREMARLLKDHISGIDWTIQFDADTPQFRTQFMRLYGDGNG